MLSFRTTYFANCHVAVPGLCPDLFETGLSRETFFVSSFETIVLFLGQLDFRSQDTVTLQINS